MIRSHMNRDYLKTLARIILATSLATYAVVAPAAQAYAFAYTVADMRLPSAQSGDPRVRKPITGTAHWQAVSTTDGAPRSVSAPSQFSLWIRPPPEN